MQLDDLDELKELIEKYLKCHESGNASALKAEVEAKIADQVQQQIL
jgi:hypothetical protein